MNQIINFAKENGLKLAGAALAAFGIWKAYKAFRNRGKKHLKK
ncbi:hypothetical protein [Sunxiuqinia elliptica]|uniref:Uncharacterized protein n=1 Tax=Sunxiuqinia elliptica TaxID=655355 RepID=A0A4R6GY68_9BACT|nr:hypothetical protein [Sunxiuqinia elliptica]TDN99950.1 hypothetical protein DET52_106163 [Sunxiuqinia elliptica]TDO57142.1 hypothetical protein DET65_3727 [Sunxiuqinia elliptica]